MAKSWLQKYATYEEEVVASAVGIVAFATGGQANATQLLKKFNQIDTVASANDSVKLVPALIGKVQGVFNNTANDLVVYPATGEYIDGTINNGLVIEPGDYVEFRAYATGRWDSYAGAASGTGTVTSVSVVSANGFAGSVATSTTTPAITIRTTITGILVGNGTSISAAVAGDFPTLNQNTTGNAATATALQTARTINGVSFDGTADIVIPSGSGTVTSVSVVTANGFSGTVATATTTPAITLTTSVTGILKGNGTAISAATSGTDYSAGTSALATGILKSTTGTGNLTIAVAGDFPTLNQNTTGTASNVTGTVAIANGGTGQTTATLAFNALSPVTTRGDIIVRGATNNDRLALGTAGKILRSDGTDLVYSTATYPNTATGTGTILRANGTNWVATTNTFPDTTPVGQILHATAANVIGGTTNFLRLTTGELILGATALTSAELVLFRKDQNAGTFTQVYNASDGTASYCGNFYTSFGARLYTAAIATGFSSSGTFQAGHVVFTSDLGNGVIIGTSHSAPLKFYTNGVQAANINSSGRSFFGGGTSATALIHLAAGTATASTAPLKFTSGTNLTTAEAGAMEYNGTNLFFTRVGTTREGVLTQSAVTTEALVSDTSITVNIGGTTYKLLARA